jgi:hypothetical protein
VGVEVGVGVSVCVGVSVGRGVREGIEDKSGVAVTKTRTISTTGCIPWLAQATVIIKQTTMKMNFKAFIFSIRLSDTPLKREVQL